MVLRGGLLSQGPAPQPYRADLAFDVANPDTEAFGCTAPVTTHGSRISEIGDARFMPAGRSVDATGLVVLPGLVASVDGLSAREWLGPSLPTLARLGVANLRWHVAPGDLAAAQEWAAQQSGPTPAIETRPSPEGHSPLRITAAPGTPGSLRLGDVMHALAGETAPSPGDPGQPAAPLQLVPGAPASFLLLRPDPSTPDPARRHARGRLPRRPRAAAAGQLATVSAMSDQGARDT